MFKKGKTESSLLALITLVRVDTVCGERAAEEKRL